MNDLDDDSNDMDEDNNDMDEDTDREQQVSGSCSTPCAVRMPGLQLRPMRSML